MRVRLSTLLGLDEHPAELPGWGPIPAPVARDLVSTQIDAEWRIAIVDPDGYLLHGDLTRRRPCQPHPCEHRSDRVGGIVEIAVPASMLDQLPALAAEHPDWVRVLQGITGSLAHRDQARAALDAHPHRRFAHAALRRHFQMRDRHCVGVGCRRRAATTELDHTHDHAHGGLTVTTNSGPCCARDHAKKHQAGWTLTQPQAGHFTWTSRRWLRWCERIRTRRCGGRQGLAPKITGVVSKVTDFVVLDTTPVILGRCAGGWRHREGLSNFLTSRH